MKIAIANDHRGYKLKKANCYRNTADLAGHGSKSKRWLTFQRTN